MKKLALLLLVLPVPAFASGIDQAHAQQAIEAKNYCTNRNIPPSDAHFGRCVNGYLLPHYHWQLISYPDGKLSAVTTSRSREWPDPFSGVRTFESPN